MTCFCAAAPSFVSPNLVYGLYRQPSLCVLFQVCAYHTVYALMFVIVCLQTLFVCLDGCDLAAVITTVVHVIAAGTLGIIEHVFQTRSVVTIVAVYHLHCFLLCSYVCCHSTSCIIPSDTLFQFRQSQCPLCLPFSVFINTKQRQSLQVGGSVFETSCFSHGQSYVVCS